MEWTVDVSQEAERIKGSVGSVLFGSNEKRANILYRNMCKMFHPDVYLEAESKVKAEEVFKLISVKWDEWEKCNGKVAPTSGPVPTNNVVTVEGVDYSILGCAHESTTVKIFKVISGGEVQYLAVSRSKDKPLNESALKSILEATKKAGKYSDYFPELLRAGLGIPQAGGKHSAVLIHIEGFEAFRSLGYLRSLGKQILHPKDIAWIWRRILSVGAVCADHKQPWQFNPDYEFIHTDTHANFSLSVLCPESDCTTDAVTSSAKLMLELVTPEVPEQIKRYFAHVASGKVSKLHPAELLKDFDYVLSKVWGERKFHNFVYPANYK